MALTSGDEVPNAGLVKQIISTFIISTLPLNAGLATGWVSPMSSILTSSNSPVGVMSKEEISYLATLPNYVGFVLSFFFGLVSNRLGRKWALLAVGIPAMISGAVLTFGNTKTMLYLGRVLAGFTIIGGLTTPHSYISETVHQSVRGMFMCTSMVQINIGVLVSYTLGKVLEYKESGSIFSPDDSSILIAGLTLVASLVSLLLIDRVGRRPLLYLAFIGGIISLTVLSVYLYVQDKGANVTNLGWIPLSSLAVSVIVYSLGLGTVPSVISNEVPPANIKPAVSAMSSATITILIIAVVQSYPFLDQYVGLYSVFVIAVVFNVLGVFFTWFMVPETRGKTLTTIIDEMNYVQQGFSRQIGET
ncbi:hypothetical protein GE061_009478 [Apolygus lucorum]|uniref:Major facilitator superfamily (MFS) profile domain-containing protein n=1 Tax=Apolygus lucorum TaxID=248454 RepID=A0A8S9Y4F3_APOLU|nr:hypothetical protein GE061_009478 [Apolygus lucorum]